MAGVIDTGITFTATETITSAKMNNIIDQTIFTNDAIDDSTITLSSGKLQVKAQGVTSNQLADNAATTAKINNLAVTEAKIANSAITNAKVSGTAAIALSKLATGALPTAITVTTGNIVNDSITAVKLNSSQAGSAPIFAARAWVSFDGTRNAADDGPSTIGGNVRIRNSGNVSSVARTAVGEYQVNFTEDVPSAFNASIVGNDSNSPAKIGGVISQNASFTRIKYCQINTSSNGIDPVFGSLVVFR